jgi:hypothetical protein
MQDLFVSLNRNLLKLTTVGKNGFISVSTDVPRDIAASSRILDVASFSGVLAPLIAQIPMESHTKPTLNFIVEPSEVILMFVAINKRDGDVETQLLAEIQSRLKDIPLENLYFSHQKIAPFVYQFVGVLKETVEKYIEVANALNIELKSIVPWVLTLPKYMNLNDPAIFITNVDGDQIIALSELNGIFFAGEYEHENTPEELQKLIKDLSFYKRTQPITRIYTLNYDKLNVDQKYQMNKIELPSVDEEKTKGFEINMLVNYVLDATPGILGSQMNLLNLLPVPVVEKKSSVMVYAGMAVFVLVLVGGAYGGLTALKNRGKGASEADFAKNNGQQGTQVLSAKQTPESTPSAQPSPAPTKPAELNRTDMTVRVENGAGVTGLAGRTQAMLVKLGYKVPEIDTASQNRASTLLKFKKDKISYEDLLKTDLKDKFPDLVIEDTLDAGAGYDMLIVVGSTAKL